MADLAKRAGVPLPLISEQATFRIAAKKETEKILISIGEKDPHLANAIAAYLKDINGLPEDPDSIFSI